MTASATSFALLVLLGIAAGGGAWLITALDAPSTAIREWAVQRPWTEAPLLAVEKWTSYQGLELATIVLAGWMVVRRRFRLAVLVVAVMFVTTELTHFAKAAFGRDRPIWQDADHLVQSGSFPSGHTSTIAAFAGLVIVVAFLESQRSATRWLASTAAAAAVVVVCADRLLLGRHYPSDLLGGVLLGVGVLLVGMAVLSVVQPGTGAETDVDADEKADAKRDAITVDDAPLGERERVLSRSA